MSHFQGRNEPFQPWDEANQPWCGPFQPWNVSFQPWDGTDLPWNVMNQPWNELFQPWRATDLPWWEAFPCCFVAGKWQDHPRQDHGFAGHVFVSDTFVITSVRAFAYRLPRAAKDTMTALMLQCPVELMTAPGRHAGSATVLDNIERSGRNEREAAKGVFIE